MVVVQSINKNIFTLNIKCYNDIFSNILLSSYLSLISESSSDLSYFRESENEILPSGVIDRKRQKQLLKRYSIREGKGQAYYFLGTDLFIKEMEITKGLIKNT